MNKVISLLFFIIINLIIISAIVDINYQSFESNDIIIVQDLKDNENLKLNSHGINEIDITTTTTNNGDFLISHEHSSKFKKNLLLSNDNNNNNNNNNNNENIESIIVYFNNNHLKGKFSRTSSKTSTILSKYPIIIEPIIRIIVNFKDGSKEIQMDEFSTIKTMTFNQTLNVCKILQSVLDSSIQPCSSKQSPIFDNLLHMGLIPKTMDVPYFLNKDTLNPINNDISIKRQRIIQSSKFNDQSYLELFNSNSYLNCLSIFNHNKLCNGRKVSYSIETPYDQLLGFTLTINRNSIEFNEVSSLFDINKLSIKYHSISATGTVPPTTTLTLLNADKRKEIYKLENSKANKLETIDNIETSTITSKGSDDEWTILKLDHLVKKSGFHRELVANITLKSPLKDTVPRVCKLMVIENLDQGIFVDRYEVDEIERFGGPKVVIYQLIDLEKPSTSSTQNFVSIIKQFSTTGSATQHLEVTLPIHLRYQNPLFSENGDSNTFRQSIISSPQIYVSCESTNSVLDDDNKNSFGDSWNLITNYNLLNDKDSNNNNNNNVITKSISINVPVGQLNDNESVKLYTLLVTVIGSILVIITIFITHKNNLSQKKK
ncbi:hypothetical protein RB653_001401 [Dictyostelium firmibasis]|uniref:Phosphatidylinositol-glycan biosynthesis class X protein n=1 Tax=Dictyostelium firmibasis TaxID=79012 RepID=A0AAN7TWY5_9MYCE